MSPLSELRSVLLEKQAELTKSERRIAEWLERRFEQLAFLTVSEIGRATGVSEATIVRFARKIGFASFTDLQRSVQAAVQQHYSVGNRLEALDKNAGPLERAYRRDLENLRTTYDHVDPRAFDAAVKAIARAPTVAVIGLRASAGASLYVAFALNLIRPRVLHIRPDIDNVHDQLLDMGPGDVLIAFSVARPALRTLQVAQEAKQRYGATVVAFTSSAVSALAQRADHVLTVGAEGTFNSYAATFSLAGAVLDAVAETLRDAATTRLKRLDAVNSQDVYGD
jgi:DNA-binding MurR/RpiR family transcriptional regulator